MFLHSNLTKTQLYEYVKNQKITLAGNSKLKIFGKLNCSSGKRMKKENRVFFIDENEALALSYRPCGNCLNKKYKQWTYLT